MGQKAVSPSRQGYGAAAGSKDWLQAGGGGSLLPHFVAGDVMYTNTSNGEGMVEFGSREDMEYALDKLHDTELDGRKIKLFEDGKQSPRDRW